MDYQLRFDTEAQALATLYDGETPRYPNIDQIGTIYRLLPAADGEEPKLEATAGYHVNVRTVDDAPELEAYQVFPLTPVRVWA